MLSDQPIATREFENHEGLVVMEIYAPKPHDDGRGFGCRFTIRWADGRTREVTVHGVDSMQALLLAISSAWVTMLYPKVGQRDESLSFLGNPDLDLNLIHPPERPRA